MNDRALQRAALTISALRTRLDAAEADRRPPVGLLGIGLRLPGGISDAAGFWSALSSGADLTSDLPAERWGVDDAALADLHDPSGTRTGTMRSLRGGWLGPVDGFDAAFWGISPREAVGLDPQQRLLLECAWEALEDAAIDPLRLRGRRVGVYVGICGSDYGQMAAAGGLRGIDAYHASGTQHSVASGRIAYALGLTGPAVSVDTACSSSLVALHLALRALRAGECELAVVGGVNLILAPTNSVGFSRAGMLSPDGRCKTFSAMADGYGRAEGCAVVVLGRLAEASPGQVWAVLQGSALGQDGASGGLTVPNGPAQAAVIRAALADAGAAAGSVGYVEAHGTGTSLGDPIEAGALSTVFGAARAAPPLVGSGRAAPLLVGSGRVAPLVVGSAKANLGHTEGAAGLVGLVKAALVRHHGAVPPHPFAGQPTPHVDWGASGLALPGTTVPLAADALVGVSSFGFSGTNAHAVLGAAPAALARGDAPALADAPHHRRGETDAASLAGPPGVFVLSARSPASLAGLAAASAVRLAELASIGGTGTNAVAGEPSLGGGGTGGGATEAWAASCWTAATGRAALPWRRAVVAADAVEAAAALQDAFSPAGRSESSSGWSVENGAVSGPAPLVWLFTGQGALRPGAGGGLLDTEPAFAEAWHGACTAFAPYLPAGAPGLHDVLHGRDAAAWLRRPSLAQPAHIALAVALAALWRARGFTPAAVLGHSLGEYAAAHVAGVLDLDGLARLVAERGRLCEALAPGGMAATTATETEVVAALAKLPAGLAAKVGLAALHGSAGSTVSGSPEALAALCETLAAMGHASDRLAGGHAYHSPLTQPAVAPLAALAAGIRHETPRISLVSTLTALVLRDVDWPSHWGRHLRQPVRFAEALDSAVRTLANGTGQTAQAAPVALEIGPHPTLTGLARRLRPELPAVAGLLPDVADAAAVQRATAILWTRGVEPAWAQVLPEPHRIVALPSYAWERTRYWKEPTSDAAQSQAHPLLGDRQPGPGTTWRFLARLDPGRQPILAGHCIDGQPVLPGAAMLAMAEAAAMLRWPSASAVIEDVSFERPLRLACPMAVQFQMTVEGEAAAWEIHTIPLAEAEAAEARWTRHVAGRLRASATPMSADEHQPAVALIDSAPFHAALAGSGLQLAEPYRGLRRYGHADGGAMAEIEVAETGPLAPMLRLDAALQAAALLAPDAKLLVPATIGRVALARLPAAFRVRARRGAASGNDLLADLTLWTMDGAALGGVDGLRLRAPASSDPLAEIAWTVTWRAMAAPPLPCDVASGQAPALADRLGALGGHATVLDGLERRAIEHAAVALAALCVPTRAGSLIPHAAALGVLPRHLALFDRLLAMLEAEGAISPADGGFRVVSWPEGLTDRVDEGPESALLEVCGRALADVLRGVADPLALLFGDGGAARVHRDSLWATPLSAQLAEAAAALLAGNEAPRVLEIGGGTGGTTGALLPSLPASARYVFTDVSAALLSDAAARFGRPGFSTSPLDIERDPAAQGFGAAGFDLVVAANVLHATRDLRTTLRHVRGLLAPGGTMALLECTEPPRWGELTFGLTEGWWRFADPELRATPPMLPPADWSRLLEAAGFDSIGVLDAGDTPWRQAIILARVRPVVGHWLILGDAAGPGRALAERLRIAGATADVVPVQADAGVLRAALGTSPLAGVVHLGALAVSGDVDPLDAQALVCAPALRLVQVLVDAGVSAPVWLVTRGAVDTGGDGPPCPVQAGLWGLGRVLRLEHPELTPRLLDVDDDGSVIDALAGLIGAPDTEAQVAWRGGRRLVARLVRDARPQPLPAARLDDAAPGPGQVDIAVSAAGVNFRDVLITLKAYPDPAASPGIEAMGRVVATGAGVSGVGVGDTVLAIAPGAFGPRVRAAAALTVPVAGGADAGLAGLPVAYLTAAWTLRHLTDLRPGQRVLVHAAAGGTGLAAVHVARAAGAEVVAAASRGKHAFLRGLGVMRIADSRDPVTLAAVGPVDVVLSSLGRTAGLASLDCLTRGGCFLELGRVDALDAAEAARRRPDVRFHAVDLAGEVERAPERLGPVFSQVISDVLEGRLPRLPVTRVDRSTRAPRRLQGARYPGKLVATSSVTEGSVLVTGAFGGLGLLMVRHLMARGVRHLVLAGRRAPGETQAAEVEGLRADGASVRVVQVDVTDQAALERLLDEIDAGPVPLRGVVHAAGVVDDSLIVRADWAAFERVLAPKVAGAWTLHQLTRDRVLDLFVLCSSAAGTLGNAGQAAHAAANASLDALAQHRQSFGLPAISIAWGPWAGTGTAVTEAVERHLAARGLLALTPADGVAAFGAALGAGLPHVVVGRVDWKRLLAGRHADPFFAEVSEPVRAEREVRPVVMAAQAPPSGRTAIEAQVRLALAAVLGLPGPAAVDPRRAFFDQGMDSLTSLEFRNRLQNGLGRQLAASIALDHPTVERLVVHLAGDDAEPDLETMDEAALGALLDMRLDGALAR